MAVEGLEAKRPLGRFDVVPEDDGRSVILAGRVVHGAEDDAVQGGQDRRSGLREDIDPQVNGPPFGQGAAGGPEGLGGVNDARLVVAPDADLAPVLSHLPE